MSLSAISVQRPAWDRRRKLFPAIAGVVVVMAMLALYVIRPVTSTGTAVSVHSTSGFASSYAVAMRDFRARTSALQAQGQQVSGGGTAQILPIYVQLRAGTKAAADRFAALRPPKEATVTYGTFTNLLRQQVTALDEVVRDAHTGSARRLAADLQRYASLVSDWLAVRPRLEATLHGTNGA